MLAFSRTVGESFVVEGFATIRIHSVRGNTVKVAIDADRSVGAWRSEIYPKVLAQRSASQAAIDATNPLPLTPEMSR